MYLLSIGNPINLLLPTDIYKMCGILCQSLGKKSANSFIKFMSSRFGSDFNNFRILSILSVLKAFIWVTRELWFSKKKPYKNILIWIPSTTNSFLNRLVSLEDYSRGTAHYILSVYVTETFFNWCIRILSKLFVKQEYNFCWA